MPAKVSKAKGRGYQVRTPNAVHAKHASKKNAKAQARLLNAIDHGYKPSPHYRKKVRHAMGV
jgi:hypothetical protein